jgi:hypothetical protein
MTSETHTPPDWKSGRSVRPGWLTAAIGCMGCATMTWMILTDPTWFNSFWPADIHQRVVAVFGGDSSRTDHDWQIELSWFSVLLRISAVFMAAAGMHVFLSRGRAGGLRTVGQHLNDIGLAMCWSWAWVLIAYALPLIGGTPLQVFMATTTPLWGAMLLAAVFNRCMNGSTPVTRQDPDSKGDPAQFGRELIIVITAAALWEAISFWMNYRLYAELLVPHGDSAMYEEHLWNVWHGKGFRSYLDQGLFLGEHLQVIHLLLLPLHMLWPSYVLLELCASLSLASCVVPIFLIARRHARSARAAMWMALAWLLFFPMHFLDIAIDLKTLRPSCYGLPFMFWGIELAERKRLAAASVCLLVALTTQEDFAIVIGGIAFVLFLLQNAENRGRSKWRIEWWGLAACLFCVVYVLSAVLVIIPAFRSGDSVHYSRYFGDLGNSPGELLQTTLRRPAKVMSAFLSFRTAFYVAVLCIPLGGLPLRKPICLLAGSATFVMLSLIQLGNAEGPDPESMTKTAGGLGDIPPIPFHHFHAPLVPVIFWAAARSLGNSSNGTVSAMRQTRFAFLCALLTAVTGSLMPCGATFWSKESQFGWRNLYVRSQRGEEFEKVLRMLPAGSRVASTDFAHTRLTHFERSYDYSGYLRAVNEFRPGVPDDTDFIVVDLNHRYSRFRRPEEVPELKAGWTLISDPQSRYFAVLKRTESED